MAKFRYSKKEVKFENKEFKIAIRRKRIIYFSTYAMLLACVPMLIISVETPHKELASVLTFSMCVLLIVYGSLILYAAITKWVLPDVSEKVIGRMDKSKYKAEMNKETTAALYIVAILSICAGVGFIIYYFC